MNHPKSVIGGDFFWHYEIDSYNILFALVDCTGHAISGSLISSGQRQPQSNRVRF